MKNWRQIEDIWIEFCHKRGLTPDKRERHYIYGKTQYYSAEEVFPEFIITYNHRYEKPDLDVQPEELTLTLKSKGYRFRRIEIKKRGLISRLFNSNPVRIKSAFKISGELEDAIIGLIIKYPSAKFKTVNNEIRLKLNEFPTSTGDLEVLTDTIKKLSVELINRASN